MSRKITNNLFVYAKNIEADNLVLSTEEGQIKISYYLSQEKEKNFFLPLKYLENLKKEIFQLTEKDDNPNLSKKNGKFRVKNISIYFQVKIIKLANEEKIIIDFKKEKKVNYWRLSELGIESSQLKQLRGVINKNKGLIIISGDKGSGKSSTLSAILNEKSCQEKSICLLSENSLRDDLSHIELDNNSFELAKKGDFDIIAIDEIKNKDHFSQAFRLALYGKLVLANIEVKNLKDLAEKIKLCPWPENEKKRLIKAVSFQSLEDVRRLIVNKNKRQKIGRFKLLFSK